MKELKARQDSRGIEWNCCQEKVTSLQATKAYKSKAGPFEIPDNNDIYCKAAFRVYTV